jgi:hypothetical protein
VSLHKLCGDGTIIYYFTHNMMLQYNICISEFESKETLQTPRIRREDNIKNILRKNCLGCVLDLFWLRIKSVAGYYEE